MSAESNDLRQAGLKVTHPRVKIYQVLLSATEADHWSAEEIYRLLVERSEDIGLATVYRVLTQFEEAGLVIRQRFENEHAVYELATGDHHDHLVCSRTGQVREFNDDKLNQRLLEIAAENGFEYTGQTVHIFGEVR